MTDKELLELAAKAAGRQIGCRGCGKFGCIGECEWTDNADYDTGLRHGYLSAAAAIRKLGEQE